MSNIENQTEYNKFCAEYNRLSWRLDGPNQDDSWLLYQLGLPFDWRNDGWNYREIGTINLHDGTVKISCMAIPSMFWKFEIITCEDHKYTLSTGSGNLVDFWPSVVLVVKGMLGVERAKPEF